VIQSTESSNRIEGVTAPAGRIRDLVAERTTPRDRPEQEIAGYRDVLNTIHGNHAAMSVTPNLVLQLHRDLFKFTGVPGGRWKSAPNSITERRTDGTEFVRFEPVSPHLVEPAIDLLHAEFDRRWRDGEVDRLLLIPAYVLDFLCIHPFSDGNGRVARLLTLLLLYQAGFQVGRFVSLERIVESSKESYYEALYLSSHLWHDGGHDLTPWTQYLAGTLIAAYRQFEEGVGLFSAARGAKTDMVLAAIDHVHGDFSVRELQQLCPSVGLDLIRRILREQKRLGRVDRLGLGPLARWRRM
jgi:Fic family protein